MGHPLDTILKALVDALSVLIRRSTNLLAITESLTACLSHIQIGRLKSDCCLVESIMPSVFDWIGIGTTLVSISPERGNKQFQITILLIHGHLHTGQLSCHFFLTSDQPEGGTWDPNYTPGVDFFGP